MRYSTSVMSAIFFLGLCLLSGCGGGGGGGGGTSAPPTIVYIGATAFNPSTSRGLGAHDFGFTVPVTWKFRSGEPGGSSIPLDADQTFELGQVTASGVALPCYRVTNIDTSDPTFNRYEWWAVAMDGGLYRITMGRADHLPGPDPATPAGNDPNNPVLLSQPRLLLPGALTVGTTWSNGAAPGMNLENSDLGHLATREVVSVGADSPHGFPNCAKVRVTCPAHTTSVWFEYWMDGAGLVEVEEVVTDPSPETNFNYRSDISTSG